MMSHLIEETVGGVWEREVLSTSVLWILDIKNILDSLNFFSPYNRLPTSAYLMTVTSKRKLHSKLVDLYLVFCSRFSTIHVFPLEILEYISFNT